MTIYRYVMAIMKVTKDNDSLRGNRFLAVLRVKDCAKNGPVWLVLPDGISHIFFITLQEYLRMGESTKQLTEITNILVT